MSGPRDFRLAAIPRMPPLVLLGQRVLCVAAYLEVVGFDVYGRPLKRLHIYDVAKTFPPPNNPGSTGSNS